MEEKTVSHRPQITCKRGSVSLFFLAFALVLSAALSLRLYIGGRVHHQIKADQAADAASMAAGLQTAQGLNMIAVNNIGIASSIQIHNSFLLMAYYVGIMKALAYSATDGGEDLINITKGMGWKIQNDVFDTFNDFARLFFQAGQGLTAFNQKLRDYWMYTSALKAVEYGKLNDPGSIILPFRGEGSQAGQIPFTGFSYEGESLKSRQTLFTSRADDAMCVVTSTNPGQGVDPDSMVEWLMGPFATLEKMLGTSGAATNLLDVFMSFMEKIKTFVPVKMGFIECGLALKSPLWDMMSSMEPGGFALDALMNERGFKGRILSKHNELYQTYGNALCKIAKAKDVTFLAGEVGIGPLLAGVGKEGSMKAAMFDRMYEEWKKLPAPRPPKPSMPFSKLNWDQCKEDAHGNLPAGCDLKVTVNENTWICPFESIVIDNIISSCGYVPLVSSNHYPKAEAKKWFNKECDEYHQWKESSKNVKNAGMQMVDWGQQAEAFTKKNLKTNEESNFGFMVIKKDQVKEFHERITNRVMLMSPIYSREEFEDIKECQNHNFPMLDQESVKKCHIEIYRHQVLSMGKDSVENDSSGVTDDHDQSMLNLSAGGTTGPDKEKNIFLRMQWAMAKSRPGFLVSQTEPDHVISPHLRTMWPAWTARPAPAKISEFFPLQGTLSILDKMIGNE